MKHIRKKKLIKQPTGWRGRDGSSIEEKLLKRKVNYWFIFRARLFLGLDLGGDWIERDYWWDYYGRDWEGLAWGGIGKDWEEFVGIDGFMGGIE